MWLTGLVAPRHVGSSQTRARTRVPCNGRQILNHCATREAPAPGFFNHSVQEPEILTHRCQVRQLSPLNSAFFLPSQLTSTGTPRHLLSRGAPRVSCSASCSPPARTPSLSGPPSCGSHRLHLAWALGSSAFSPSLPVTTCIDFFLPFLPTKISFLPS